MKDEEVILIAKAGLDIIQCEKFSCDALTKTVADIRAINPRIVILAAGGVSGENADACAATGVDVVVTNWVYFGKPADIKVLVTRQE